MVKNTLILIIFFFVLAVFQSSFFIHFPFVQFLPNPILVAVILLNIFFATKKSPEYWQSGVAAAFIGGFFWDLFSSTPFGFYTILLLLGAVLIHSVFRRYVRIFKRA